MKRKKTQLTTPSSSKALTERAFLTHLLRTLSVSAETPKSQHGLSHPVGGAKQFVSSGGWSQPLP